MALQMILGGSGSGKTHFLYETVIREAELHPEQTCFVIVPEQFTMQAQKDIVCLHPRHATMNIDVVSFQRLAYRVFEELAVEQLEILDDMGKSMVLRKTAAGERRRLRLFGGHLSQNGFISQLKTTISEFYQYGITPQILREMAPLARTPLSRQKMEDLAVIFQSFEDYIEGHYITTEEVLDVLCRELPRSEVIRASVIALDGYAGFMPVQYRLLELFMVYARQVYVTVTADRRAGVYRALGMQDLFHMSSQMVRRLAQLAGQNQVRQLPDIWLEDEAGRMLAGDPAGAGKAPELIHLERNLFRPQRRVYAGKDTGAVLFYQAATPAGEVARVVHEIRRLVCERGLRYRDMAVVTGALGGYGGEVAHQFTQSGIPFFLDDKKNILDNPMTELVRAALEAVRRDFSYESVFRYLRTGLVTGDREMTDRMENYVLAMGIRGSRRWGETWGRTYRGGASLNLDELNAFRETVMAPLFALRDALRQENVTVGMQAEAVKELLITCRAEEKMEYYRQYFLERGEYRLAKEYGQIYEAVIGLLDRLIALLGEEQVSRAEFMEILDAGLAEVTVGVIPATVDRVVVGDLTRTRLAHVKVLFFVGVNDGIVPMRKGGGSLLSDAEREFFGEHRLELAPTAREDSFQQRFFLYRVMTRPQMRLAVSYAAMGADGKSRRPSYLVGELRKMFPAAVCLKEAEEEVNQELYTPEEAKQALIAGLRTFRDSGVLEPQTEELCRFFAGDERYREELKTLVDAAFYVYEKQGISHAAAQALYGRILSGSVTRLEQYAACAYGHFLKFGLELDERQRYELGAADIGNLFHDSIDLCFRSLRERGGDWRTLGDEERTALVSSCVAQVTGEYGNTILGSSSRNAYLGRRVEEMTQRTVWALQQQIIKGDFEPAGFEVSFSAADNLQALKISLSPEEELHLRGRIDRVDLCEDGGQVYVKIIDYKSGSTSFDLMALYYGLQLQLVVYMDAVMELTKRRHPEKEVVPAGILYYNIADPMVEKDGLAGCEAADIDREILRRLRMNGLVNSELEVIRHLDHAIEKESDIIPVVLKDGAVQEGRSSVADRGRFESLRGFVHEKVKRAGQEILGGSIAAEPYKSGARTACDYCPYHAVCGFDKKISGYEYRKLRTKKTAEIWEELCQ